MAKFELELSVIEKRRLMGILASDRTEYNASLKAAKRGEVAFDSDEQKEKLIKETTRATEVISNVLNQLHDQDPH